MGNNDTNLKLANVIFDLAKNAEESGKYEDAIKSYKEALNVFEQALGAEDEKTKEVYTNIGMCYKALGKNEEALTYLTKALSNGNTASVVPKQEEESEEDEDEDAILLEKFAAKEELGRENLKKKKYNEAIDCFLEAKRAIQEVFGYDVTDAAHMDDYIARCYQGKKNYNEAINYYAWAIECFDKQESYDKMYSLECRLAIAYCYFKLRDNNNALIYFTEYLEKTNNDDPFYRDDAVEMIETLEILYEEDDEYDEYDEEEDYEDDEYDEEYSVEKAPRTSELSGYGDNYSDSGFWNKVKKLGKKVLKPALQLYYVMKEPSTPFDTKSLIIGALGYLILPIDLIPDFIPVGGYTDDLAALLAVVKMCKEHITPEIERKVRKDLGE